METSTDKSSEVAEFVQNATRRYFSRREERIGGGKLEELEAQKFCHGFGNSELSRVPVSRGTYPEEKGNSRFLQPTIYVRSYKKKIGSLV